MVVCVYVYSKFRLHFGSGCLQQDKAEEAGWVEIKPGRRGHPWKSRSQSGVGLGKAHHPSILILQRTQTEPCLCCWLSWTAPPCPVATSLLSAVMLPPASPSLEYPLGSLHSISWPCVFTQMPGQALPALLLHGISWKGSLRKGKPRFALKPNPGLSRKRGQGTQMDRKDLFKGAGCK